MVLAMIVLSCSPHPLELRLNMMSLPRRADLSIGVNGSKEAKAGATEPPSLWLLWLWQFFILIYL